MKQKPGLLNTCRTLARIVLAFVFIAAATGKILHPQEFADAVAAFRILPIAWVNIFAIFLPWMEVLCGIAILLPFASESGAMLMLLLNVMFMMATASAMARGLDIQCGCFTISRIHERIGWGLLARDSAFILLCILSLSRPKDSGKV